MSNQPQPPLRISCAECQTGTCEDCLVAFFTTDRPAEVLPFSGRVSTRRGRTAAPAAAPHTAASPLDEPLPDDLAAVLSTLEAAGLDPELLDVVNNDPAATARPTRAPRPRTTRRSRAS